MTSEHRDVSVLVLYNDEGRMLLEHRAKNRKRFPNLWAMFGGAIEKGESRGEALQREIKEELKYNVRSPVFIAAQPLPDGVKYVFVEKYDKGQTIALDPTESQGCGWFTFEEAEELESIPHDFESLKQVSDYIQSRG